MNRTNRRFMTAGDKKTFPRKGSIASAMSYAKQVAAEFKTMESGYRNSLYSFLAHALTSYHNFLRDPGGYAQLLRHDGIAKLREKPELESTSRLVLYYLTGATNAAERNTAQKYAAVVDHLHREHISEKAASDYIRNEGGVAAIMPKARAPKTTEEEENFSHDLIQAHEANAEERDAGTDAPSVQATAAGGDARFDSDRHLAVTLTDKALVHILSSAVGAEESFFLECRKIGADGSGWVRIVGRPAHRHW